MDMTPQEMLKSDDTPLHGHNERCWCDWCGAQWVKPDWRDDVSLFGHPLNDCRVWDV
jgi:hypothetical protein